ncbi:MAG: hypothetical protein ACAH83_07420 [Alphaproteobacteria bacterium]
MTKKKKSLSRSAKKNPFVGTWVDANPYFSEVEFKISKGAKGIHVKAWDPIDKEAAEISDVSSTSNQLSFTAHWRSTGRITTNKLQRVSSDQINCTFTWTETAILVKKSERPAEFHRRYGRRLTEKDLGGKRIA